MNRPSLEILGPDQGAWQGWPTGAKTMFDAVLAQQMKMWVSAGSPLPAPDQLMGSIDQVMESASKTELALELERADPQILTRLRALLRERQQAAGMLSDRYLNSAI